MHLVFMIIRSPKNRINSTNVRAKERLSIRDHCRTTRQKRRLIAYQKCTARLNAIAM